MILNALSRKKREIKREWRGILYTNLDYSLPLRHSASLEYFCVRASQELTEWSWAEGSLKLCTKVAKRRRLSLFA